MQDDEDFAAQPLNEINERALAGVLPQLRSQMEKIAWHVNSSYLDQTQSITTQFALRNLTVRNALSLIERAALGLLKTREQGTLLHYLVEANLQLRRVDPHRDSELAALLYYLELQIMTAIAFEYSRA